MVINLNLVVDKQNNRVAYVECDGKFVDILFSLFTLPLGTIVRLLNKDSGLRFLDNLYQSIENLETKYFQTESCKSMLLQPRSNAEKYCEDLAINIDDLNPRRLFRCKKLHGQYSSVVGVKCSCGKKMDKSMCWEKKDNGTRDGVFLKCSERYIVTDNLHVQASCPSVLFLQGIGITNVSMLEEIAIQVDRSQVLNLLKRSFTSKTPLTDVFQKFWRKVDALKTETRVTNVKTKCEKNPMKEIRGDEDKSNAIKVKIMQSESSEKLVVKSENDFADLIFSFLTLPLGSALSLLGKRYSASSLGCIHNLYNSMDDLNDNKQDILLASRKDMLLNPKLPPFFGCSNQILKVNEMKSIGGTCNSNKMRLIEQNPKIEKASSENGGGFASSSSRLLIYNDTKVKPIVTTSIIELLKDLGVSSPDGLREKEVLIGEAEALNLLLACLTSTPFWNLG